MVFILIHQGINKGVINMRKQQLRITEQSLSNVYTITIDNARFNEKFNAFTAEIFTRFLENENLFLGLYRTDGVNLTRKQSKELNDSIEDIIKSFGERKIKNKYLSVVKIDSNDNFYNFVPTIFDYFLESIIFNPKVSWESCEEFHFDYANHRAEDIIARGYTNILFFYFDSGDFSVMFNPEVYTPREIRNIMCDFFEC